MAEQDAFVEAARLGNIERVNHLRQQPGIRLDGKDSKGATALSESICNGQDDVAWYLLDAGADITLGYGLLAVIYFLPFSSLNYM